MFSVNRTRSFTLKLDQTIELVKTIFSFMSFGSDRSSWFSRDLTNEQPFLLAYGKMSVRLLVTPYSMASRRKIVEALLVKRLKRTLDIQQKLVLLKLFI